KERYADERIAGNEAETKRAVADSDAAKEGTAKANERVAELSVQAEQLRKDAAEASAKLAAAQVDIAKAHAQAEIAKADAKRAELIGNQSSVLAHSATDKVVNLRGVRRSLIPVDQFVEVLKQLEKASVEIVYLRDGADCLRFADMLRWY